MTVPYPPAVWYLPKHVRDALINNTGQARSEPAPVASDEPVGECEEHEQPLEPGQLFVGGAEGSYEGRQLVDPDRSVIDSYHESAYGTGSHAWCRNPDCLHLAPAPGDPCPVCLDKGWKAITGETGDAA